jgi:hypothetical protein
MSDLMDEQRDERMDHRLAAAGARWVAEQPLPPAVAMDRLTESVRRRPRWQPVAVAAAATLVVGGGTLGLVRATLAGSEAPSDRPSGTPVTHGTGVATEVVPFRATRPGHVKVGHRVGGHLVTPYDGIVASGKIGGTVHPGDTLSFVVALESDQRISLHPCPDYSIAFGTTSAVTRRLNCTQVPYYASIPLPNGKMSDFRPTLPAQTPVMFQMRMRVPDELGRQKVLWTLDGPLSMPGFYGIVRVVPG